MEAGAFACVQSTRTSHSDCRAGGASHLSAARRAGRNVLGFRLARGYFHSWATATVAAEAAAAFHFEDSGLAAVPEVVGAKSEPAAAAEAGVIGRELRCDRSRARHRRRILPRLPPCRGLHR